MVEELYISGIPLILERKKIKNMYIRVIPPTGDFPLHSACYALMSKKKTPMEQ